MTHAVFYDYTLNGVDSVENIIPDSEFTDPGGDDMAEIQQCNQFLIQMATNAGRADQIQYNEWDALWDLKGDDLAGYSRYIYYVTYVD